MQNGNSFRLRDYFGLLVLSKELKYRWVGGKRYSQSLLIRAAFTCFAQTTKHFSRPDPASGLFIYVRLTHTFCRLISVCVNLHSLWVTRLQICSSKYNSIGLSGAFMHFMHRSGTNIRGFLGSWLTYIFCGLTAATSSGLSQKVML